MEGGYQPPRAPNSEECTGYDVTQECSVSVVVTAIHSAGDNAVIPVDREKASEKVQLELNECVHSMGVVEQPMHVLRVRRRV